MVIAVVTDAIRAAAAAAAAMKVSDATIRVVVGIIHAVVAGAASEVAEGAVVGVAVIAAPHRVEV